VLNQGEIMKNDLKTQSVISSVAFCLPPVLFISQNIHAYIDAGTGTLIIQFLIAGFVGGLFLIKVFWKKVKAFFGNLFARIRKGTE
jgi:hypothetical protein